MLLRSGVIEPLAGYGMACDIAGQRLPAADGGVDVQRIELDAAAAPADTLGCDQGGAAAEKGIEHHVTPGGRIQYGVGNELDRLHRRMQGKEVTLIGGAAEGVDAGIVPDIGSVAAMARKPPGTYTVGYGKPPVQTRFQPGQSGNPQGRRKGAKNWKTHLAAALDERVTVKEGGKQRKITKLEATIKQLVNKSAGADLRAMRMLFGLMQIFERRSDPAEPAPGDTPALTETDEDILAELKARLARSGETDDEA